MFHHPRQTRRQHLVNFWFAAKSIIESALLSFVFILFRSSQDVSSFLKDFSFYFISLFILFFFIFFFFSLPVLYWSSRPAPLEFDSFCWVPFAWVGLALSSVFIHSSPLSCKRNNSYISKKWYFKKDMSFLFLNQLTISWVENERHFSCWNNERPIFDTFLCRVAVSLFVSL